MSYSDEVSLCMVGQDIKVNSKVMKGTRSELLKQEAMLDKYKKGRVCQKLKNALNINQNSQL